MGTATEMKIDTTEKLVNMTWCPNFEYTHSAEKARNTTLDDEKYDVCYSEGRPIGNNMSDGT